MLEAEVVRRFVEEQEGAAAAWLREQQPRRRHR